MAMLLACEPACQGAEVAERALDQACETRIEKMRERLDSWQPHPDLIEDRPWLVEVEEGGAPVIELGALVSFADGEVLLEGDRVGAIGQPQPEVLGQRLDAQVRNWQILNPSQTEQPFPVYVLAGGDLPLEQMRAWLVPGADDRELRLVFRKASDAPTLTDPADAVPGDAPPSVTTELRLLERQPSEAERRSAQLWSDAAGGCPALGRLFEGDAERTSTERKVAMRDAAPEVARQCGCGLLDVPTLEALVVYAVAPRSPEMVWVPLSRSDVGSGATVQSLADSLGSR